jgi:hypothetical protein
MNGWKPIETAPKDGTSILLSDGKWVGEGYYSEHSGGTWWEAGSHWTDAHDGQIYPTHWQPLPPPPSEGEG